MGYVFQCDRLTKRYGHFKALDGLSMRVEQGSIYGLVGKNGAGKTTLIRIICGLQSPTSGGYALYEKRHDAADIHRARRRMGAIVETPSVYLDMSAEENLRAQYRVLGRPSFKGIDELLALVGLEGVGGRRTKHFSLGMRQRLGIAVALAGNPDFLVLDEPVNGLDPQGIVEIRELILKLNREKRITVLISSHILDELSRVATHYGFIDGGRIVREISAKDLEAACRRCTRLTVNDALPLIEALEARGAEYAVVSEGVIDVYGDCPISPLMLELARAGCEVRHVAERNETLESYYINLIGGGRHA